MLSYISYILILHSSIFLHWKIPSNFHLIFSLADLLFRSMVFNFQPSGYIPDLFLLLISSLILHLLRNKYNFQTFIYTVEWPRLWTIWASTPHAPRNSVHSAIGERCGPQTPLGLPVTVSPRLLDLYWSFFLHVMSITQDYWDLQL